MGDRRLTALIADLRAAGCMEAAELIEETTGESREVAVHCVHAVIENFTPKSKIDAQRQDQARRAITKIAQVLDIKLADNPTQHPETKGR